MVSIGMSTFAQNSQVVYHALEGWRESIRRLNQVSQTFEFVDQFGWSSGIGSRTNRSRIQLDQKLLELDSTREWLDTFLALPFVASKKGISSEFCWISRPSGPAIRGIQEGESVSKTFWPCLRGYPRREIIFCSSWYHHFPFSHLFRLSY